MSLTKIEEKLGAKRRDLSAKHEAREKAIQAVDAAEAELEAFESLESMTDIQAAEYDEKRGKVKALVASAKEISAQIRAIESEINELEDRKALEAEHARGPQSLGRQTSHENPAMAEGKWTAKTTLSADEADHDIASFMRCSYLGRQHGLSARAVAAGGLGDDYRNDRLSAALLKSANPALVPENYVPRLIELLRPKTVVRRMQGLRTPPLLNGNLRLPRQNASSSAAYVATELANIAVSQPGTNQITLSAKKLTAMVVQSGEIMRHAGPETDRMIRDDLIEVIARKEDITFLRSDGTSGTPTGLKSHTPGGNVITANATVNLANVVSDLGKLILAVEGKDVAMLNPYFVFHPRVKQFLMDLRDGNGNPAFPEMLRGELRSYPFLTTTQLPINLGAGTNQTEVYFVDASEIILADSPVFELRSSDEAAYHDGSAVQAAFSQDAVVFRAITEHDLNMRHTEAVAYLSACTWGA